LPDYEHSQKLTRRQVLVRGGTAALGLPLLLDARDASGASLTETSDTQSRPKRGGTLRHGVIGGSSADTLSAGSPVAYPDFARFSALYNGLSRLNAATLQTELELAESIEPNANASEWTIRVHDGIEFHNGKTLGVEDIVFTFNRIVTKKLFAALGLQGFDAKNTIKLDKRTLRIKLHAPSVVFGEQLANINATIVPVGYDPKKPVGTGPFMFRSFTPGQQSTFVRNPNYYVSGKPYLDSVVIVDIADDSARLNALISGSIDVADNIPPQQASSIKAASGLGLVTSKSVSWNPFTMRVDRAPFDDVRVRQAFRLIVDRPQMIQLARDGYGTIANDMFSGNPPAGDPGFPQRHQDLARAIALLKKAGKENLSVQLVTSDIASGVVQAAQVFAQQAKGAGVTVKIKNVTAGEFFGKNYTQWTFAQDFWFATGFLLQVTLGSLKSSPFNETHWNDPKYVKLFSEANRTPQPSKLYPLIHEMERIDYDRGGYIIPYYNNILDAHSSKVGGLTPSRTGLPLHDYRYEQLWLK
jgi:peptide/nickel transport system substrate-binding protein